jgi:polyphosphate:AMP phosphotransferase
MWETAELGLKISKAEYEAQVPGLRYELLKAQRQLRETPIPVVVVLAGDDGPARDQVLDRLYEWLDARYLDVHAADRPTDEEKARPPFWRIWRVLPPRGEIGIYLGGGYYGLFKREFSGKGKTRQSFQVDSVRHFERMLVDDGALFLKFFLHLPPDEFRKRDKKKKLYEWTAKDRREYERFGEHRARIASLLHRTSQPGARWEVIDCTDRRHRDITVAHTLLKALWRRFKHLADGRTEPAVSLPALEGRSALAGVDLSATIDRASYEEQLGKLQTRVRKLSRRARRKGRSSVLVFQGWDAAGKGGAIRRLIRPMDARNYRVIPIGAPTDEEKAHHYLWRFWRHVPADGRMAIFDRSWYGRVLVERVEGFATEAEWQRAYDEINDFESQLTDHGIRLAKFWMHISPDEQLRRFEERQNTPHKQHKITGEDWRNRENRVAYEQAVDEMVARTSTDAAPWTIIPANSKHYARIEVLKHVRDLLE